MGADYVQRVTMLRWRETEGVVHMLRGKDNNRDQTYF